MNKFYVGQKVWLIGFFSGIRYPAVVIQLPTPAAIKLEGTSYMIHPYIQAYRLESDDGRYRRWAAPETQLRPRYDGEPFVNATELAMALEVA